jgi:hypothetical protein
VDPEFLTELLAGRHFNMEERVTRGAWPNPPLQLTDLTHHLARVIEERGAFPSPWSERRPNAPVGDRTAVERRGPREFVGRYERSGPHGNLAEEGEHVFASAEAAAAWYLRAEFDLPGDLDGWRVV